MSAKADLSLIVRRSIRASVTRCFEAWTRPDQLLRWWGPEGVKCTSAEVEARLGGRYCIGNELPGGEVLWIEGEFLAFEPPEKLVYTWSVRDKTKTPERVTVRFEARGDLTEVVVIHEQIGDESTRTSHESGWVGCLSGLESHLASD